MRRDPDLVDVQIHFDQTRLGRIRELPIQKNMVFSLPDKDDFDHTKNVVHCKNNGCVSILCHLCYEDHHAVCKIVKSRVW